jgi:hypothetical protein
VPNDPVGTMPVTATRVKATGVRISGVWFVIFSPRIKPLPTV